MAWAALVMAAAGQPLTEPRPVKGQSSRPASATAPSGELPADVLAALAEIQDFAFHFDQAGYYRVLEYVKESNVSPGHGGGATEISDWRELLERPNDFRGEPITVEGVVGHNKDPYRHKGRLDLGWIWQLELSRPDQPIACTLICTNDVSDIPLNATVRVTGYFVMVRQYYDATNRVCQAALLVAPGPTLVMRSGPRAEGGGLSWEWAVAALAVSLLAIWFVLRRSTRATQHDLRSLRADRAAPMNLADDLAAWAAEGRQPEEGESPPSEPDYPRSQPPPLD